MNSLVNWFCLIFVCIFSVVILAEENKHFYHMTVNEGSSLNGFALTAIHRQTKEIDYTIPTSTQFSTLGLGDSGVYAAKIRGDFFSNHDVYKLKGKKLKKFAKTVDSSPSILIPYNNKLFVITNAGNSADTHLEIFDHKGKLKKTIRIIV